MRIWMLVGSSSDNPYRLVKFLGAGQVVTALYDKVPPLKELKSDEAYFFENPIGDPWRIANTAGILVLNNDVKQRTTFSALLKEPSLDLVQPLRPVGQPIVRSREVDHIPGTRGRPRLSTPSPTPIRNQRKQAKSQFNIDNITLERARELFRSNEPPQYQEAILARFNRDLERVAKTFATKVSGCEYYLDGLCPSVFAPIDSVDSAIFMKAAKQAGAFEVLAYRRLVKKVTQNQAID
jgi:hypothetical protein